ncbi:protein Dok-7 [Gouania willdenowi]|uniref:Protein Dok-7-like n=1 Tax=Gouania willdenowi TaxID=441366 RepID=A0A8C5D9L0_GOUWI|nr:protein Dok-7-like [Gouania willdenowi]
MTDTVVAEGQVKFRDGKKWKTRWLVLRKPSPVADCLSLLIYKDKKKGKEKGNSLKERLNITLEGICGMEPGPGFDGVSFTLSILCMAHTLVLGFSSRETLMAWDSRVRYSLGEAHRFSVHVEPGTKLQSGSASLHLCNNLLVLSRGLPPVVIGHWKLSALRRYGAVPNGFVFEGGSRCGPWAGVFFLSCAEGEQISFLFDCFVRGINPSRAPHGLRPKLPDLSADRASSEERINQETSELEKRLSMLSHCSLASSTASTYSYSTSVAGDDHSSLSSSSSSQSDASYGSKLPFWLEPLARQQPCNETASSSSTVKALTSSNDMSQAHMRSRGLHDSGRQSSLDSGIGIVTGSPSSYSGSCSSCTGSLDMASQLGGEELGSVASIPAPPSSSSSPPPPTPPSPLQATQEPSLVRSPPSLSSASRSISQASHGNSEEFHIYNLLRHWYDTPRSLLSAHKEPSATETLPEPNRNRSDGNSSQCSNQSPSELRKQRHAAMQHSHSLGSERAPSVASEGSSAPSMMTPGGRITKETQCSHGSDHYITPEQWRSAWSRCSSSQVDPPTSSSWSLSSTQGAPPTVRQEHNHIQDVVCRLVGLMRSSSRLPPAASPPPPRFTLSEQRPTPASGDVFLCEPHSENHYINVSISTETPGVNTRLYSELNLHQPGFSPQQRVREGDHDGRVLPDAVAMETSHRAGAELIQSETHRARQQAKLKRNL